MRNDFLQRRTRLALSAVTLATLTACANFSGILPSAKAIEPAAVGLAAAAKNTDINVLPANSPALDSQWWHSFGDSQLDALIDAALANNPSLRVAQARVERALAATGSASALGTPTVNGVLDATQQRYTKNGAVPAPLAGSIQDSGTLQASASWELDLFGKNRAALDAALGQSRAAQADAQAARMLLASNVTRSYFQWQRIGAQLEVAQRALAQREQAKRLVQDRVNAGLDTQLELNSSESAVPDARYQIEVLKEQEALVLNSLAALTSQQNKPLVLVKPARAAINSVADMVPAAQAIPLDLLGRRADIAAARWRVEAATQDVANAKAQFYPNINLTAFAGYSSIGLDKLLLTNSQQYGIGPAIRLPLFEGGKLRANLTGKTADLDAAVETYNAIVIDAVRDVADQLTSLRALERQQVEQRAAQASAESAYAIALQRYEAGLGNYLSVLNAETAVLTQRRLAVDLGARAIDTQVQLIRALGGGFHDEDTSQPTTTTASTTAANAVTQ